MNQLLKILRERKVSVEEVTRAFLRRAALAQAAVSESQPTRTRRGISMVTKSSFQTNCIADLAWEQAISRARYLDSLPEPQGALFGLPISTKEHHGFIGSAVETTASYVSWVGKKHGSNLLYDVLWREGCVFYVRTT